MNGDPRTFRGKGGISRWSFGRFVGLPYLPKNELVLLHRNATQELIARGQASHGTKLLLLVDRAPVNFRGYAPDSEPITLLRSGPPAGEGRIMVGFGPDETRIDRSDPGELQEVVRRFLPGTTLLDLGGHNWNKDPYSRGTWPVLRPGQATDGIPSMRRPQGRVVFAGSYTARLWNGYVDGAIESGFRAARQVRALHESSRR